MACAVLCPVAVLIEQRHRHFDVSCCRSSCVPLTVLYLERYRRLVLVRDVVVVLVYVEVRCVRRRLVQTVGLLVQVRPCVGRAQLQIVRDLRRALVPAVECIAVCRCRLRACDLAVAQYLIALALRCYASARLCFVRHFVRRGRIRLP